MKRGTVFFLFLLILVCLLSVTITKKQITTTGYDSANSIIVTEPVFNSSVGDTMLWQDNFDEYPNISYMLDNNPGNPWLVNGLPFTMANSGSNISLVSPGYGNTGQAVRCNVHETTAQTQQYWPINSSGGFYQTGCDIISPFGYGHWGLTQINNATAGKGTYANNFSTSGPYNSTNQTIVVQVYFKISSGATIEGAKGMEIWDTGQSGRIQTGWQIGGTYLNILDTPSDGPGFTINHENQPVPPYWNNLNDGQWHRLTIESRRNSVYAGGVGYNSSRDGFSRAWIDGTKVMDYSAAEVGVIPSGATTPWCTWNDIDQIGGLLHYNLEFPAVIFGPLTDNMTWDWDNLQAWVQGQGSSTQNITTTNSTSLNNGTTNSTNNNSMNTTTGILFQSDWSTGTGSGDAAIRDTNQNTPWASWESGSSAGTVLNVVPSTGLNFPTANVLQVTRSPTNGGYSWVQIQNISLPAIGSSLYYRLYLQNDITDYAPDDNHHPIESAYGGAWTDGFSWNFGANGDGTFPIVFELQATSGNPFPLYHYAKGNPPQPLTIGQTYRLEWQLLRTGVNNYTLDMRVYNSTGSLIWDKNNILAQGQGVLNYPTLASVANGRELADSEITKFRIGTNGGTWTNLTTNEYFYFGGVCISSSSWCGPYNSTSPSTIATTINTGGNTASASSSGGGGGGGGSATTPIVTNRVTNPITNETTVTSEIGTLNLTPASPGIFSNFAPDTGVQQVELNVNSEVSNVTVTVSQYGTQPSAVPVQKTGKVYEYLHIEPQNAGNSVSNATVIFNVNKTWINENAIQSQNIALFKFYNSTNSWEKLQTNYTGSDLNHYSYTTQVPGFSYFAIGEVTQNILSENIPLGLVIIFIAIILIIIIIILVIRNKRRQYT